MSAQMDQLLDKDRLADIHRHDAEMAGKPVPTLSLFDQAIRDVGKFDFEAAPGVATRQWPLPPVKTFAPEQPMPMLSRPDDSESKGERHEAKTVHDSDPYVNPRRRLQDEAPSGLTQQATNSTCVTARRDGLTFREFNEQVTQEVVWPITHAPMFSAIKEKMDDEYAAGLDRVGPEWEGDEE